MAAVESGSPHPIPPKRSFTDFDEPDPSLLQSGTTKRLRTETVRAEQTANKIQQPKPLPLKRLHLSFLEDSVDRLPLSPDQNRYHFGSVIQWLESISGVESYRERHCRSDNLRHSGGEFIPRRLTKSAPNMESTRDTNGSAVPPTLASGSWAARSVGLSNISGVPTSSSQKKTLVEDPFYRLKNLDKNNIYLRSFYEEFPKDIARLVDLIRKDRDTPDLPQLSQDTDLEQLEIDAVESDVEAYFQSHLFPQPRQSDCLKRAIRQPMSIHNVPNIGLEPRVSIPKPDLLYGYNGLRAFPQQQAQLGSMEDEMRANNKGLMYPFFVIEFKADGPNGAGSLWVATNQCLGGSTSCVNIAERLNHRLRRCKNDKVQTIDSAVFSIAMNGTEARLYISWKHNDLEYYMRKIKTFSLQEPEQYMEFRKHVQNIVDWGLGKRLKNIQNSLDSLLEERMEINPS